MQYKLLGLFGLVGCINGGGGGTNFTDEVAVGLDSGEPAGDVALIQQVDWDCEDQSWHYEARSDGYVSTMRLQVVQTGRWDGSPQGDAEDVWRESHRFFVIDEDPGGAWALYGGDLTTNTNQSQVANSNGQTFYRCGVHSPDNVAFAFQVLDAEERVFDCAIWGNMSEAWFKDRVGLSECLCFESEEDGACGARPTGGDTGEAPTDTAEGN